jgi:hypothetical protein
VREDGYSEDMLQSFEGAPGRATSGGAARGLPGARQVHRPDRVPGPLLPLDRVRVDQAEGLVTRPRPPAGKSLSLEAAAFPGDGEPLPPRGPGSSRTGPRVFAVPATAHAAVSAITRRATH